MNVILELNDHGPPVQVSISEDGDFVCIQESGQRIYISCKELTGITEAVAEHLSAAEGPIGGYVDECVKRQKWDQSATNAPFWVP